ncbi:MAG: hypothetical protein J6P77_06340, partial [Acetobacter sp.]|nr:hypothetical protein [Acetobacter sp.]
DFITSPPPTGGRTTATSDASLTHQNGTSTTASDDTNDNLEPLKKVVGGSYILMIRRAEQSRVHG